MILQVTNTLADRETTHGSFIDNAEVSQFFKKYFRNFIRTRDQRRSWDDLNEVQREALDMIAAKICRILSGNANEADHWRDIAGYATLVEQRLVTGFWEQIPMPKEAPVPKDQPAKEPTPSALTSTPKVVK